MKVVSEKSSEVKRLIVGYDLGIIMKLGGIAQWQSTRLLSDWFRVRVPVPPHELG